MPVKIGWDQALAWRMERQLDPIGDLPAVEVVSRLCGVQAQVASSAELAVRILRRSSGATCGSPSTAQIRSAGDLDRMYLGSSILSACH